MRKMKKSELKEMEDKWLSNRPKYDKENPKSDAAISYLINKKAQQSMGAGSMKQKFETKGKFGRSGLKDVNFHQKHHGTRNILDQLSPVLHNVEMIDLSNNSLGKRGVLSMCDVLGSSWCRVVSAKMVNCSLSDKVLERVCSAMSKNISVRLLNLSNNRAGTKSFVAMGNALKTNNSLKELHLSWNKCYGFGLEAFSEGLALNKGLRRLNLSSNLLGKPEEGSLCLSENQGVNALALALKKNTTLLHLDLSDCNLNATQCEILAESLNQNHTLTGIHFHGNKAFLDAKGFLVLENNISMQPSFPFASSQTDDVVGVRNQCWECQRWFEHQFHFDLQQSVTELNLPNEGKQIQVYLHLSIDGWKADEMEKVEGEGDGYRLFRMLPCQNRVWYFFSLNGQALCDKRQPIGLHPRFHILRNYVATDELENATQLGSPSRKNLNNCDDHLIQKANRESNEEDTSLGSARLLEGLRALPRIGVFQQEEQSAEGGLLMHCPPKWDVELSAFAGRLKTHGVFYSWGVVRDAIEADFSLTKIQAMKLIETTEEIEDFKAYLEGCYTLLNACFQYFTGHDPTSDPFSIQWLEFKNFCEAACIPDAYCTVEDLHNLFKVTNVELEEAAAVACNDDNTLERFEFLELLLRIGNFKYPDAGGSLESFKALLKQNIEPHADECGICDGDTFRKDLLYSERVSKTLDAFEGKLKWAFSEYSSKLKNKQLQEIYGKRMNLSNFFMFVQDIGAKLEPKQIGIIFKISQLLTPEVKLGVQTSLGFVGFLESLLRLHLVCHHGNGIYNNPMNVSTQEALEKINHFRNFLATSFEKIVYEEPYEGRFIRKIPKKYKSKKKKKEKVTSAQLGALKVMQQQQIPNSSTLLVAASLHSKPSNISPLRYSPGSHAKKKTGQPKKQLKHL